MPSEIRRLTISSQFFRLHALLIAASLAVVGGVTACGGGKNGESLCTSQVPAPTGCNAACDPAGANTCSAGYFCAASGKCDIQCTQGGNQCGKGNSCTSDGMCVSGDGGGGCTGLACQVTDCQAQGKSKTTLTGTVFAPNGTLPLYGVSVYVPNTDPGAFTSGATCDQCGTLPGNPISSALTDENGNFTLTDVPNGTNIPVVITIGKWRRQIKLANVDACTSQPIAAADTTLPKSRDDKSPNTTSVDMPQIAISTGSADSLECLVRRLGIADKEITTDKQSGAIHLFSDNGASDGTGVASFDTGFAGGSGAFSDSQTLWGTASDPGKLDNYDIVILSCEGAQHVETKTQDAMNHLKAYADLGGRVFLSHWHNIWIEGSTVGNNANGNKPDVWPALATWSNNTSGGPTTDTIDETHNPKGASFATWMLNVGGSPAGQRDAVPLKSGTGKNTCTKVDNTKVEQWVYWQQDANTQLTQNFQFTTPNEKDLANRCGKVVFSDMHVSGGPVVNSGVIPPYPTSCGATTTLSAQEKALAFMFFDIASCVGTLF